MKKCKVHWNNKFGFVDLGMLAMRVNSIYMQKLINSIMKKNIYIFILNEDNRIDYSDCVFEKKQFENIYAIVPDFTKWNDLWEKIFVETTEAIWIVDSNEEELLSKLEFFPKGFFNLCECKYFEQIFHYWFDEGSFIYTFKSVGEKKKFIELDI